MWDTYVYACLIRAPGLSLRTPDWTRYYWTPVIVFIFPTRIFCRGVFKLCDWLSLQSLEPWINHWSPACRSISCKSVLNKLVCKFDIMENIFSSSCKYILMVTINIYILPHTLSSFYISIFTSQIVLSCLRYSVLPFPFPFPMDAIRPLSNENLLRKDMISYLFDVLVIVGPS